MDRHATVIQSHYRGYRARKSLTPSRCQTPEEDSTPDFSMHPTPPTLPRPSKDELHHRATTIQSRYRGYRVRKSLNSPLNKSREGINATGIDAQTEGVISNYVSGELGGYLEGGGVKEGGSGVGMSTEMYRNELFEGSMEGLHRSATRIQSTYRGFMVRKSLRVGGLGDGGRNSISEVKPRYDRYHSGTSLESENGGLSCGGRRPEPLNQRHISRYAESSTETTPLDASPTGTFLESSLANAEEDVLKSMELIQTESPRGSGDYDRHATRIQAAYRGHRTRGKMCAQLEERGELGSSLENWRTKQRDRLVQRQNERTRFMENSAKEEPPQQSYRHELFDENSVGGEVPTYMRPDRSNRETTHAEEGPVQNEDRPESRGKDAEQRPPKARKIKKSVRYQANSEVHDSSEWARFYVRQSERYLPLKHEGKKADSKSKGYRVRLQEVEFSTQVAGMAEGEDMVSLRVGVTLWDSMSKSFFGNTLTSKVTPSIDWNKSDLEASLSSALQFDIYFHSKIRHDGCHMVVELIAVKTRSKVAIHEVSLGFFMLPIFKILENIGSSITQTVEMFGGSPRYLFFQGGDLERSPSTQGNLLFQVDVCPEFCEVSLPLIPQNFLVTYSDVIPGLQRLDKQGQPTNKISSIISTLSRPVASQKFDISLRGIKISIPWALHKKVSRILLHEEKTKQKPKSENMAYALRAAIHCGRCLSSSWCWATQMEASQEGSDLILDIANEIAIEQVPADSLAVIVLEIVTSLLEDGNGEAGFEDGSESLVAWAAINPFADVHTSTVCRGVHEICFDNPSPPVSESSLVNWRERMAPGEIVFPRARFHLTGGTIEGSESEEMSVVSEIETPLEATISEQEEQIVTHPHSRASMDSTVRHQAGPHFSRHPQEPSDVRDSDLKRKPLVRASRSNVSEPSNVGNSGEDIFATSRQAADILGRQDHVAKQVEALQKQVEQLTNTLMKTQQMPRVSHFPPSIDRDESLDNDIQRFRELSTRDIEQNESAFSGGLKPEGRNTRPDRALMAQVHTIGGSDGLPPEIQAAVGNRLVQIPRSCPIDLGIESQDARTISDVVFQFLAVKTANCLNSPQNMASVYFTYQLYDFPPTATKPAILQDGPNGDPAVKTLKSTTGRIRGAGVVLKYAVEVSPSITDVAPDPYSVQHDRHVHFCNYLAGRSLVVDVWEGESMLQIGSVTIKLDSLLRQGRQFNEQCMELPILDSSIECYRAVANQDENESNGQVKTVAVPRGHLILRIVNLGRIPEFSGNASRTSAGGLEKTNTGNLVRPVPFKQGVVTQQLTLRKRGQDESSSRNEKTESHPPLQEMMDMEHRKILRQRQLQKATQSNAGSKEDSLTHSSVRVRENLLNDIQNARSRSKRETLKTKLRQNLASKKVVEPSYGETLAFHHEFRNPFGHDDVFVLRISHPDMISIVTDEREWRSICGTVSPSGKNAAPQISFGHEILNGHKIFLQAEECIRIGFNLQTVTCPDLFQGITDPQLNEGATVRLQSNPAENLVVELLDPRTSFPLAVLELKVFPRPAILDRTIRMHGPEREPIKHVINVDRSIATQLEEKGLDFADPISVVCSRSDVLTEVVRPADSPSGYGISLRCKTGLPFDQQKFYVVLYTNGGNHSPAQIWLVYLHSWRRVHLQATIGQTSQLNTVIKGKSSTKRVKAFSTHPDEVQVAPESFVLAQDSIRELLLSFRPVRQGQSLTRIQIVDTDTQSIIDGFIVSTLAEPPTVSQTFEVGLHPNSKIVKKISFSNPYHQPRSFYFRSNMPWLITPKPQRLDLPARGVGFVGLEFDSKGARSGQKEALLFVNDDDDKSEECYKIRVDVYAS
ncbi:hypothetical protein BSKO_10766 [Bryopsis sp. KO-2023]|nr:hypothetical protein BSKO_10766 [Bryopsis sp. KO-2023]